METTANIFGLPIPDDYEIGISFSLSKVPFGDHFIESKGVRTEIKSGQKRVHVFLNRVPTAPSMSQAVDEMLVMAQELLDHLAVRAQLSYRILDSEDYMLWQRTNDRYFFEINVRLALTFGMSGNVQLVHSDGSIQPTTPVKLLQAKAFRYYRFASSSEDLFEAYHHLYLCFESALYDFYPRQGEPEWKWLKDGLRQAIATYSLDLSAFSAGGSDPVDGFYTAHYKAIRCATFHAQNDPLLPGSPEDVREVDGQLRLLEPIVKKLLQEHFGASFLASRMTEHWMNNILGLLPGMRLATTPKQDVDLAEEIRSALESVGYFEAFPKRAEDIMPDTEEKLSRLIERAREKFPFDLTKVALSGKRPGYDDEWIVTAKTTSDVLQHRNVRSMALCFLFDPKIHPNVLLAFSATRLAAKTLPTYFDVPDDTEIEFKIRVLMRHFQAFPRDFASN